MALPARKPKISDRDHRWRSPAHLAFVRSFTCAMCGSATNIAAAHVRKGGHGGMGIKPDDFRAVPLCDGPNSNVHRQLGCHNRQHIVGEDTLWHEYREQHGQTVEELIAALIKGSPRKDEIARLIADRIAA